MDIDDLRLQWTSKDIAVVGRKIFETIPEKDRPLWAARILQLCMDIQPSIPNFKEILEIVQDEHRWAEAYEIFLNIRKLRLKRKKLNACEQLIFDIGELVAKIIYNSSGNLAPFDTHSGWRMAPKLRNLVEIVKQPCFEENIWSRLVGKGV